MILLVIVTLLHFPFMLSGGCEQNMPSFSSFPTRYGKSYSKTKQKLCCLPKHTCATIYPPTAEGSLFTRLAPLVKSVTNTLLNGLRIQNKWSFICSAVVGIRRLALPTTNNDDHNNISFLVVCISRYYARMIKRVNFLIYSKLHPIIQLVQ